MRPSFVDTRSRSTDGQTSRDAARHAATDKAAKERLRILAALCRGPMTAREIAEFTGIDYYEVQRRISETGGIEKTTERRGKCTVWRAV
jgi:DNA invertase Pin-like site-specific DNA recombinase